MTRDDNVHLTAKEARQLISAMRDDNVHLTAKEARQLISVIGEYQGHLEAFIERELLADRSVPPSDPGRARLVALYRRRWKRAEDLVKLLSGLKAEC